MLTIEEAKLIRKIAERAADLYGQMEMQVKPEFIESELTFVQDEVTKLRLKEFLEADDSNFAHDIGGIHRHLNMPLKRFEDCFVPRFAVHQ